MNPIVYILSTNGLLFLLSIIFWKFPPKKINNIYGYRTPRTMRSIEIWNFANNIFNRNLLIYSGISLLGSLLLANFSSKELTWQPMILVLLCVVVSIVKTERLPSSSTKSNQTINTAEQLSKWKTELTQQQISRILNIVELFEINIYDDSIMPLKSTME